MQPETLTEEPLSAFEMPESATPPSTPTANTPPRPSNPVLPGLPTLDTVATQLYGADGTGGARGAEAAGQRAKAEGMQPLYAGVQSALDEQERVAQQRPTPPELPAPPSRGLRDFLAVSENETPVASIAKLLQAMSLFTMSTVGASRHNAVGAMAAFAGAMKGWQEGDAQRADRDFADWEAKTHKALTDYKLQTDDYSRALTASGLSVEGRTRAMQLKALEFGDSQTALHAEGGNLKELFDVLTTREHTQTQTAIAVQKMLEARREAQRKETHDASQVKHWNDTTAIAQQKLAMGKAADAAEANLTPGAIEVLARDGVDSGKIPTFGVGQKASEAKIRVVNRMGEILQQEGGAQGLAQRRAFFNAASTELTKLTTQRGMIGAFEKTAQKNLDIVEEMSNDLARSKSPLVNKWTLSSAQQVSGDPKVAAFNAAVRVAINEVAKVTSGASGGAVTSDTARHEIEGMLSKELNPGQITAVAATLRRDMNNRIAGFDESIKAIDAAMRKTTTGTTGAAESPKPGQPGSPWQPRK